ncbi:hypothetical protein DSS3PM1_00074 [Bacteriophage DSS3_PM1]|nr:hypothetical protein DSS3PM1_00074 [Bacteriophage DSS3_PM1]
MIRVIKAIARGIRKVGSAIRNNRVSKFVRSKVRNYPVVRTVLILAAIIAPVLGGVALIPMVFDAMLKSLPLVGILISATLTFCIIEAVVFFKAGNIRLWWLYVTGFVRHVLTLSVTLMIVTHLMVPFLMIFGMVTLAFYFLNGLVI